MFVFYDIFKDFCVFSCLPVVHEALQEFGGPELVHLSDHADAHVSVSAEQPAHVLIESWRRKEKIRNVGMS